jgi:type II secretory pathway pseudopilin PulG
MTRRDRTVMIVVGAALLLAAFWFLALSPKRKEASALGNQLATERQQLDTARNDASSSRAARSTYGANYTAVARLGKAVPADDDVPSLLYQLNSTADATDVDFRTIKLTAGGGSGGTGASNAAQNAGQQSNQRNQQTGGQTKNNSTTPPQGAAPATQAASAGLPPGAVVGQAGLSTMPFSFTFEGSFFRLSDFFGRLESYIDPTRDGVNVNGRLLVINGLALSASGQGFPRMKAAVSATTYLLPAQQGMFNGATPGAPPSGGGQPASSSGNAPTTAPATARVP